MNIKMCYIAFMGVFLLGSGGWRQVKNILKHGDYSGWGWTDQAEIIQVNT